MMYRETCPYHDFTFHHTFRMMVVGPTEFGKTHFVKQLLTKPCIKHPTRKLKKDCLVLQSVAVWVPGVKVMSGECHYIL